MKERREKEREGNRRNITTVLTNSLPLSYRGRHQELDTLGATRAITIQPRLSQCDTQRPMTDSQGVKCTP